MPSHASDRTGGRVQSADVGGAVCELGGEWVSPAQAHIQTLLAELGIATFNTYTTGKNTLVYDGKVTRFDEPPPPLPMADLIELTATIARLDLMVIDVPLAVPSTATEACGSMDGAVSAAMRAMQEVLAASERQSA